MLPYDIIISTTGLQNAKECQVMGSPLRNDERYTYYDYYNWDDDKRWELIEGAPHLMAPAPGASHQRISGNIFKRIGVYLEGKTCQVYYAPFDVRLNAETGDDTVLQPDIVVVCDSKKITERGCYGAPDMVVEILSPSSVKHDRLVKFKLYQQAGVREYWIVDPESRTVQIHLLENGKFDFKIYGEEDTVNVHVLDDCRISLNQVFAT